MLIHLCKKDFEKMKQELIAMEPHPRLDVKQYNILLVGAVGSGKSSFCNTVGTVFSEKRTPFAVAGAAPKSVTNKKKCYDLKTKDGKTLNIRITDIRGIEDNRGLEEEFDYMLDGSLPDRFQFPDKAVPIQREKLKNATLNEAIHLVCFVAGPKFIESSRNMVGHFEYVKKKLADKDLPSSLLVTKMDDMCSKVKEDVDHIFKCKEARDKTKQLSEFFGVPLNQTFPVVNYTLQGETQRGIDRLALHALYEMYCLVHAHLEKHEDLSKPLGAWKSRDLLRQISLKEFTKNKRDIHKELSKFDDKGLRILCFGPSRSGKSSFIESVLSTFSNKICSDATRGYTDESSATNLFQLYQIKYVSESGETKSSNVYLADMPGIQEEGGVQLEDAKQIVMGHVANKCHIQRGVPKNSKRRKENPQPKDQIHCVCFVLDLSAVDELSHSSFITMCREFKTWLSDRGVPFVVVVTKCDQASERCKQNPARVFEDRRIEECKDKLVQLFKVKENKIYPVQNYVNESTTVQQIEVLLLEVTREVLDLGWKYLNTRKNVQETVEGSDENGSEFVTDGSSKL